MVPKVCLKIVGFQIYRARYLGCCKLGYSFSYERRYSECQNTGNTYSTKEKVILTIRSQDTPGAVFWKEMVSLRNVAVLFFSWRAITTQLCSTLPRGFASRDIHYFSALLH